MNYLTILFSLLVLLPLNLIGMELEPNPNITAKLNRLPNKVRKLLVNSSFSASGQISLEEKLDLINWAILTKEEISIICSLLESEIGKQHPQLILNYLISLQYLCSCIDEDSKLQHTPLLAKLQLLSTFKTILEIPTNLVS